MKSYSRILICFFITALFLIALSAPVSAAYVSTIDATWVGSTAPEYPIPIASDHKIVYEIHANEATFGGNYVFTVKLDHNNSAHTEPNTGFAITGYTRATAHPDVILNVELNSGGTEIIYTLKDPTVLQIELVIQAKTNSVYPDEVVDISSNLSRYDLSGNLNQVADEVLMQAKCIYPTTFTSTGSYELINPTVMPVGGMEIDLRHVHNEDSLSNTLRTLGMTKHNKGYTVDFSDVMITIGGVSKTYADWQTEPNCPVTFYYSDGSPLSSGHLLTFTSSDASSLGYRTLFPFKMITNSFFIGTPDIDFSGAKISGEVQLNARGPNSKISHVSGELILSNSGGSFTGSSHNTDVSMLRSIYSSNSYIMADSISFAGNATHSHLLYQDLFKSAIDSSIRDGTSSVTITYEIPNGVTVTHIRIPASGGNVETQYGKISLVKDGNTYDLGNGGMTLDLVNHSVIAAFTPGEDVVFEFENVLKLNTVPGSRYYYNQSHSLSFIGTTDSSVTSGTSLTFTASTNEFGSIPQSITTVASNKYYMTSFMSNLPYLIGDSSRNEISSIGKEEPFYFYVGAITPSYPFYSTHYTDTLSANAGTSGVFSSPVFYFSLPEGIKVLGGTDAAEIVNSAGAPIILSDINTNVITPRITAVYENAGLYPGGTLVEVKLEDENSPNDPFWLRGTYFVRLKVFIESEYSGSNVITIQPESILMSSWDPDVAETMSIPNGGRTSTVPSNPVSTPSKIHAGTMGTYPPYLDNRNLFVASEESVQVGVSVMTPLGNMTYIPGDDSTYPQLRAGSSDEKFRIFFSNGLSSGVFSNADLFFILPQASNWKPILNDPAVLTASGFANPTDYRIQYTTDPINPDDIGDISEYNNAELQGFSWTTMTFTGGTADAIANPEDITAIRVQMDALSGSERLILQLPFGLPPTDAGLGINYGDTARGQTIYYLNSTLANDNSYTAAVMLIQSAEPVVSSVDPGSSIPRAFADISIDYQNDTIPNWYEFYTYDDFTEDLEIHEVRVTFTPYVGAAPPTQTISKSDMTSTPYVPQKLGSGSTQNDDDFVKGYKWTIPNPTDYVSSGTSGEYLITYITAEDGDSQSKSATQKITMAKNPATIRISTTDTSILWNTPLGTTVDEYFKAFVTAEDDDVDPVDLSRVLLESSSPTFNIGTPGTYVLTYNYTDSGNNVKSAPMTVSVLFNETLTGTVLGNGVPIENFVLDIDGTLVSTNAAGQYEHEVTALTASPTTAFYSITFDSLVPAGLNYSSSSPMPITGSGSFSAPAPIENINFDAVSMTVEINGPIAGIDSVKLYHDSYASPIAVNNSVSGDVVFERDPGLGWFESGFYYFVVELNPGYRLDASGGTPDFSVTGSILDLETAQILLNNDDIEVTLDIEIAPMISGFVWADANRDSLITADESLILSTTVNLYDAAGTTLINQTATNSEGYYVFVDLDENLEYIVGIPMPSGFNSASALTNDQKLNGATLRTNLIDFTSTFHVTDINAGFYWRSAGGGTGGGTIIPPGGNGNGGNGDGGNGDGSGNGSSSGSGTLIENGSNNGSGTLNGSGSDTLLDDESSAESTKKSCWWWILLLLLLLIIIGRTVYVYYKKRKDRKEKLS